MTKMENTIASSLLRILNEAREAMQDAEYRWLVAGERTSEVHDAYEHAYIRHEAAKQALRDCGVEM